MMRLIMALLRDAWIVMRETRFAMRESFHAHHRSRITFLVSFQIGLPKVRPALLRPGLALFRSPCGDCRVVAAEQDIRDAQVPPRPRAGVLGIFQQPVGETL